MLALVFSAPSALTRRLQAQESPCIGLSADALADAKAEDPPTSACGMYTKAEDEAKDLCPNGVVAPEIVGGLTISQREVAKARVSAPNARNIWVTNEYGTVLAWFSGGGNNRDMDLDEQWGQATQLTGHASYADGTCAQSAPVDTYQKMVDDFMSGDGYFYTKANPTLTLSYSATNGRISLGCSGCVAPFADPPKEIENDAGATIEVCSASDAPKVSNSCPGVLYVKDTAGNVLYADDTPGFGGSSTIETLRSPSVLTACFEPGKCKEVDVVSDAITAITRQEGAGTDKGKADIKFYGKCSGAQRVECTLSVPIEIDCAGPVTTWVDGLADTTVDGAGGRPIGFGIDKELKFPKGTYESTFEAQNVGIYYYCPDVGPPTFSSALESRTTTPAEVQAAKTVAVSSLSNYFPVTPEDYGLPPCPDSASNQTVTTDELSCRCDNGTTFCTRVESGHVTMLSPVEVAVVVICVLIVVLVAICMCAFAAKKKMIVKEVKHGPGNAL
jgi:hypothetical protein